MKKEIPSPQEKKKWMNESFKLLSYSPLEKCARHDKVYVTKQKVE